MDVKAKISMTARELGAEIDRFISDNRHSRDVEMRWLTTRMTPVLTMLGEIISQRGLGPELRAEVNAFRDKELEAEIESKRIEIEKLERDRRALKSKTTAAA